MWYPFYGSGKVILDTTFERPSTNGGQNFNTSNWAVWFVQEHGYVLDEFRYDSYTPHASWATKGSLSRSRGAELIMG